ncbi:MAG: hypothetical protein GX088_04090 [Clostridia bacterium]|nr:hypothetical protein [Clostridia bacterium]
MKRVWLLPVVLGLLLLVAWHFRWEKGPIQTDENLKNVHLRDRWTGQNWIVLYGWLDGKEYSGEAYPHLNEDVIAREASLILKSPEGKKKKQDLEAKLAEAEEEKKKHSEGHTQYLRIEKQLRAELEPLYYDTAKETAEDDPFLRALQEIEEWGNKPAKEFEITQIVRSKMPSELVKECDAWRDANQRVKKLNEQINKLPEWAQEKAKEQFTQEAYAKRSIVTGIWVSLVGISLLTSVCLAVREKREKQ